MRELIDKLNECHQLEKGEWERLLSGYSDDDADYAAKLASGIRDKVYGKNVFIRGLIEISSYCKNDCLYCGIRKSNRSALRYRLTKEEILSCCSEGWRLGFRTFVLQGGEDLWYSDSRMADIVSSIRRKFADCAITLSLGERPKQSLKLLFDAGADRYLLRQESANSAHYSLLHPPEMQLETRLRCLYDLKEIGYQVGCGFMVGSPFQTASTIADDMVFIRQLEPQMVGIGPFLPHSQTPFKDKSAGSVKLCCFLLSLIRIMLPDVLLPATTALSSADEDGRIKGILAGANVVMPNLSPPSVRKKYKLYDNKKSFGAESAGGLDMLRKSFKQYGFNIPITRGDSPRNSIKGSDFKCTTLNH